MLSTTSIGTSQREVEPRGVGGVDNGRGDAGRSPAIVADAVMRQQSWSSSARARRPARRRESARAESQVVPTQIGVRSASRSASIRISGAPVFKAEQPRQFARRGFLGGADQLAARLAAAGADDFGKPRA